MKKLFTVFILLASLLLSGCQSIVSDDSKPGLEGYVVKKENGRVLVVNPVPEDYSSTGGVTEFHNAIWFSNASTDVKIGDKVQVWFDVVQESYPGQSEAKKISIIPSTKHNDANLTEAEAVRKALATEEIREEEVPIIKAINYEKKSDVWMISIKQGEDESSVQIDDH